MKFSGIFGLRPSASSISASVAALGALAITAQANAADIYAPVPGGYKDIPVIAPVPVWTGFYAGINMGAAWSQLNVDRFYEPGYTTCYSVSSTGGYCLGGDHLNSTNAFGGGQLGYNWQGWGNFVVGLEVDLEGVAGGNERSFFGVSHAGTPFTASFKENGGFAGDVTGRLGYAWGNWLLYAKGGFAWFNPDISARATAYDGTGAPLATIGGFSNNTTLTGWTIGGGVEWLLNPNWSVKVEYLYYDFGLNDNWNATYCPVSGSACSTYGSWKVFDHDLTVNTVKLGVNYHLTSGYVPLK
jgi:outer membrane immunogenic protein